MFGIGLKEILVLLAVLVLVFGLRCVPRPGRTPGAGIREFKRSVHQFGCEAGKQKKPPAREDRRA